MAQPDAGGGRLIAQNRRARHEYAIEDTFEAGIALVGSEVKSLRAGKANIAEAYARAQNGEIVLLNAYIAEYAQAGPFNHEPRRPRRLLLHARQITRLAAAVDREGMTLVPLRLYFNERGRAKIELALAKGKRQADRRETVKQRDWQRQKARLMREKG